MTISFGFQAPALAIEFPKFSAAMLQAGFTWMEITLEDYSSYSDLAKITNQVREEFCLKISVHARFMDIDISNPYTRIREKAVELIEEDMSFASDVHASRFVVHGGNTGWFDDIPGNYPESISSDAVQRRLHKVHLVALHQSLMTLSEANNLPGLLIVLENLYCPWELISSPDELESIFKMGLPANVGFALDFGHARVSGFSPMQYIRNKSQSVNHVHLHENDGKYDLHNPISSLSKDYETALNEVHKLPEEVPVILEWRTKTPDEYISRMKEVILMKYMKGGSY
jgi:sugar phosphate isomerase/epimerase